MRVLICEDNPLIATMLEDMLVDLGHEPCGIAIKGSEAPAVASRSNAEFALVDLDLLDGRTGFDVVERLADAGVGSVIVSGHSGVVSPAGSRAVAILGKPVDEALLGLILARQAR